MYKNSSKVTIDLVRIFMNKSLVTRTDCPQESKQLWEQHPNSCQYPLINYLIWKIAIDNEKIIWIRKIISNFHQPSNSIRKSLRQQDFDTLIKIATITTRFEALFVLEQAHHFGRFNFWISNNCWCFLHWKKSKQIFKIQHVQINALPRTWFVMFQHYILALLILTEL